MEVIQHKKVLNFMFSETSILDFCFSLGALVIDLKSGESKNVQLPNKNQQQFCLFLP